MKVIWLFVLMLAGVTAQDGANNQDVACDLDCQNGGYCAFVMDDVVSSLAGEAQDGKLIQKCICRPRFTGKACERIIPECSLPNRTCYNGMPCEQSKETGKYKCNCAMADKVSSFAGRMCRQPYTEYCNGKYSPGRSFCANGGKCKTDLIPEEEAASKTTSSSSLGSPHAGCVCPDDFYGPHCEFLRYEKNEDKEYGDLASHDEDEQEGTSEPDQERTSEPDESLGYPKSSARSTRGASMGKQYLSVLGFVVGITLVLTTALVFRRYWRKNRVKRCSSTFGGKTKIKSKGSTDDDDDMRGSSRVVHSDPYHDSGIQITSLNQHREPGSGRKRRKKKKLPSRDLQSVDEEAQPVSLSSSPERTTNNDAMSPYNTNPNDDSDEEIVFGTLEDSTTRFGINHFGGYSFLESRFPTAGADEQFHANSLTYKEALEPPSVSNCWGQQISVQHGGDPSFHQQAHHMMMSHADDILGDTTTSEATSSSSYLEEASSSKCSSGGSYYYSQHYPASGGDVSSCDISYISDDNVSDVTGFTEAWNNEDNGGGR